MIDTPIFDAIADDRRLLCPTCGSVDWRGLIGADERGADLDVCTDCWMRGLHWPDERTRRTCVDCGKVCFGLDGCMLVTRVGTDGEPIAAIALCLEHYGLRVAK